MGDEEIKIKADPRIHKIPDSLRNSDILPLRSVPWGSVGFRENFREAAVEGVAMKETKGRPSNP